MATKPTVDTAWATDSVANGVNSTNNKVQPTPSHAQFGITFPEPPGRNHFNYWMNSVHQWKGYFEAQMSEGGLLGTNYNINQSLSDYTTRTFALDPGVVLSHKEDNQQVFSESPQSTLVVVANNVSIVGVRSDNGAVVQATNDLYRSTYEIIPLYRVTTNATDIITVVDLRSSIKGGVRNGGYNTYDPQDLGAIQGNYTTPITHNNSDPGFFLGKYGGSGTGSDQGFAVTNSATDYIEYSEGKFELGPDTIVTGVDSPGVVKESAVDITALGYLELDFWRKEVGRTTYPGLFTALGTGWGDGNGVNTFNLPPRIPATQAKTTTADSASTIGSWPGTSMNTVEVYTSNGDIWAADLQGDAVYKMAGGEGGSWAVVGTYPSTFGPIDLSVNQATGDIWIVGNTGGGVWRIAAGTSTFTNITTTVMRTICVNPNNGDVWGFSNDTGSTGTMYKYTEASGIFTVIHSALPFNVGDMCVNPTNDDVWMAGTSAFPNLYHKKAGLGGATVSGQREFLKTIPLEPSGGDISVIQELVVNPYNGHLFANYSGSGWIGEFSADGTDLDLTSYSSAHAGNSFGMFRFHDTGTIYRASSDLIGLQKLPGVINTPAIKHYIKT